MSQVDTPSPNPASGRSGPRPDLNDAGHRLPEARKREGNLTHLDDSGAARMVDVSGKSETQRRAIATGRITMSPEAALHVNSSIAIVLLRCRPGPHRIGVLWLVQESCPFRIGAMAQARHRAVRLFRGCFRMPVRSQL